MICYKKNVITIVEHIFILAVVLAILLLIHMAVTWVGIKLTTKTTKTSGNDCHDQILNNLKQGVVLVDRRSKKVLFVNSVAEKFQIYKDSAFSMRMSSENGTHQFDMRKQAFAHVNRDMFTNSTIDSDLLEQQLKALNDFKSLD